MNAFPKLRALGYKEPWVTKRVDDIAPLQRGFDLPNRDVIEGDFPVVFSNGILKHHAEYKVEGPGVVTGRSGTIGKVTYVEERFWPHNTSLWVTDFKGNFPKYIYYFYLRFKLERYGTGSGVPTLNRNDVHAVKCNIPSLSEQKKIAGFLGAVDEKLRLQRARHDALTEYKKGVMQKIFAQTLRFKADDSSDFPDWDEKNLGEICEVTTGRLDANAAVEGGQYPFYTCAKDVFQIDTAAFDTEALLISGNGANVGYIHYCNGKFNAYQRTYVLDKFEANIFYIEQFLIKNLKKRIYSEAKEGNTPYIVMGTLTELKILLPHPDEQQKIANFLSAIDDKISAVASQITQMQDFKKGLLQQMFV